jgi:hypothetical protein
VVIKASSAAEIRTLIDALVAPGRSNQVHREAAIARLTVIGPRAVAKLIEAYGVTADRAARIAILRALEGIGDHRALPVARQAVLDGAGGDVALAAVGVLRSLLTSPHERSAATALDTLVSVTLDRAQDRRLRQAGFDALQEMPASVRVRVAEALGADSESTVNRTGGDRDTEEVRAGAVWDDAANGQLPESPEVLREIVPARAPRTPLNTLRKMIDAARTRERDAAAADKERWRALRGSLHQSLALRGSRVALYDLRESIEESQGEVPASFVSAIQVLGDRTCLEPLAALWERVGAKDAHGRHQISAAFQAVAKREKAGKRDALMKRILAKSPGLLPS